MVLVRKNELACRADWDGGLWEAREDIEPIPFSRAPAALLVAEATPNDHLADQYTDRVTSVGVAPAARSVSDQPRRVATFDDRLTAIEADDVQAHQGNVHQAHVAEVNPPAQQESNSLRRELWSGPEAAKSRDERPTTPRQDERYEQKVSPTPRPSEPSNRVMPPATRPSPLRQDDDVFSRSWGAPSSFPEDRIRPVAPRISDDPPRPVEPPRRAVNPPRRVEPAPLSTTNLNPPLSRQPAAEPASTPFHVGQEPQFGARGPRMGTPRPPQADPALPEGRSGWTEPFEVATTASAAAAEPPQHPQTGSSPSPRSNGVPVKYSPNPQLATLPQCCGTCRDFRPAEGGERGWCNNQFAFDHRRMVQRNDLACRSTIGVWWIASDDWWQQQADISHHGRPTPVVDDLLRQLLDSRGTGTNQRKNVRN